MKNKIKTYGISIAIALAVGGLSAFLTKDNMRIYDEIALRRSRLRRSFFRSCGRSFSF